VQGDRLEHLLGVVPGLVHGVDRVGREPGGPVFSQGVQQIGRWVGGSEMDGVACPCQCLCDGDGERGLPHPALPHRHDDAWAAGNERTDQCVESGQRDRRRLRLYRLALDRPSRQTAERRHAGQRIRHQRDRQRGRRAERFRHLAEGPVLPLHQGPGDGVGPGIGQHPVQHQPLIGDAQSVELSRRPRRLPERTLHRPADEHHRGPFGVRERRHRLGVLRPL